ncbi:hypothetical protein [Epilithonimonas mollis]|uniref:Uncharacterized protein n=1 Tax=Epilithonimonas mollis TaxID=216903 RepID=A0A1M6U2F3_9FLAO|nr:hypothetical protein [Epilithonimonas mollis]SHK63339.1 hypothetical protein SAMN05444371_3080 [Epilithonimonas mollis]
MSSFRNYNNSNNSNWNSNRGNGYNRSNSSGGYGQKKKRSGAKFTRYVNGKGDQMYLTTGWKVTKNGLISIKCTTTKDSKESDKGWFGSVACTFVNVQTGETNFHWGTMEAKTGKVVIDRMAMVINPRAKNGGYAGTFIKK